MYFLMHLEYCTAVLMFTKNIEFAGCKAKAFEQNVFSIRLCVSLSEHTRCHQNSYYALCARPSEKKNRNVYCTLYNNILTSFERTERNMLKSF